MVCKQIYHFEGYCYKKKRFIYTFAKRGSILDNGWKVPWEKKRLECGTEKRILPLTCTNVTYSQKKNKNNHPKVLTGISIGIYEEWERSTTESECGVRLGGGECSHIFLPFLLIVFDFLVLAVWRGGGFFEERCDGNRSIKQCLI